MRRLKVYALATAIAAACSGLLCVVYAMPPFTLVASPGVVLGLMAAGNTPDNNDGLIFFGNWVFYSLVFFVIGEVIMFIRRARSR